MQSRRVKVISLLQPWATLMVLGLKRIETRSWNTKHRGELFIHASAGKQGLKMLDKNPYEDINQFLTLHNLLDFDFPLGKILGSVNVLETGHTEAFKSISQDKIKMGWPASINWEQELAFGDYSPGRYGWLTDNWMQLKEQVPAKGKLSIWEFDLPHIAA